MNVRLYVNGGEISAVSFERLPLRGDEELLKVPSDICPVDWTPNQKFGILHERAGVVIGVREFIFQIGKDRMRVYSVDVTLLKYSEVGFKAVAWPYMLQ